MFSIETLTVKRSNLPLPGPKWGYRSAGGIGAPVFTSPGEGVCLPTQT
jgi:hypothetical protein